MKNAAGIYGPAGIIQRISGNTDGTTALIRTGTFILHGGNNITLSQNGNNVTIVGGAGGPGGGSLNISAGTTSQNLTNLVMADANGITFGLNGSTVTASHNGLTSQSNQAVSGSNGSFTFQTVTFGNLIGLSFYSSNGSLVGSYTVPTVHAQFSGGLSTGGNSAGDTGAVTGQLVLAGGDNITLSGSTNAGSMTVTISAGAGGGGVALSAGTQSVSTGTVVCANSYGISFGMSNSNQITASYTVPTQSAQTIGGYFVGNTTGQSSSSTVDGRSVSIAGAGIISAGWSAGSIRISATQSNQAFSAGAASSTFQTLTFQDSNGVSFSNNAGAIRLTHDLQYTSATSAITSNALHSSASRVINIVAATNNTGGGTASLSSNVSFSTQRTDSRSIPLLVALSSGATRFRRRRIRVLRHRTGRSRSRRSTSRTRITLPLARAQAVSLQPA